LIEKQASATVGACFFVWLNFIRLLLLTRTQLCACAVRQGCPFFVVPQRKGERKGTKGPNALWKPRARKVVPLSLHSFFREGGHLQLLHLQVQKTCKHGRRTQRAKANALTICDAPWFNKISSKNDFAFFRLPPKRAVEAPAPTEIEKTFLPPPAARGEKAARDAE